MAAAELAGTRGDRVVRRTLRAESRRRAYAGRHPPGSRPAGNRRIRDRAAIAPEFSRKESPARGHHRASEAGGRTPCRGYRLRPVSGETAGAGAAGRGARFSGRAPRSGGGGRPETMSLMATACTVATVLARMFDNVQKHSCFYAVMAKWRLLNPYPRLPPAFPASK